MSMSAVRFFVATVVALVLIVLTQGLAPSVQAAPTATFDPDPLRILDGTSADLTVTVTGPVTAADVEWGSVRVNLIPGVGAEPLQGEDAAIPAGTEPGAFVTVTVNFRLKCVDNKIEGTGEGSVEFGVGFGIAAINAIGLGIVSCAGDAIVTLDPDPLEVPNGSQRKVTVTVTKLATALEVANKNVHLRLIHPNNGGDVLLDTADVPIPGATQTGQRITVTTAFPIDCTNNEIRGRLNGTGTDFAELQMALNIVPEISNNLVLTMCIEPTMVSGPSGGSHPSSVVFDPWSGLVYVLNAFDGAIGVFDGTTQVDTIHLPCPSTPAGASSVEPGGFNCIYQGMHLRHIASGLVILATDFLAALVMSASLGSSGPLPAGTPEITTIPVGAGPTGIDGDESTGNVYVANNSAGTVSVIDTATDTVFATLAVGGEPSGVIVDSVNGFAYVSNFALDIVHVINTSTNIEVGTIAVGNGPDGMEIDADTGSLWVTNFYDGTVTVVDLYTSPLAVASLAPRTIDLGIGTGPNGISLNRYTNRVYTANALNDTASVINRTTGQVVATIDVGLQPDDVVAHPNKGLIYVANHEASTLSMISDPNPYVHRAWGDLNCDGEVTPVDVLGSLRRTGALPLTSGNGCPAFGQGVDILPMTFGQQFWGDVNCDDDFDGYDALFLILFLTAYAQLASGNCPLMGGPTYVW